jgi:cobalt/nickel transport system permease protein
MTFVAAVVSTPPIRLTTFTAYAGMTVWASALAGIPLARTVLRAAAVLPFTAVAALGVPFTGGGEMVRILGAELSVRGLWVLAGVSMKSFLCAAMLSVVASSAGFDGMAGSLRALGVPGLFIDLLSLSWRQIHVLAAEAGRLRRAAASRGFRPRWLPQASIVGKLAGNLFVRSYERAERVHGAMVLRGYGTDMPVPPQPALTAFDLAVMLLSMASIVAVRLLLR